MIPITVSYFLKQSEKSSKFGSPPAPPGDRRRRRSHRGCRRRRRGQSPLLLAAVYSSTIALVLTIAGVLLLPIVQRFSQHWGTNLGVAGGLFVFFALSLFGMYDITLPSWLPAGYRGRREGQRAGRRRRQ